MFTPVLRVLKNDYSILGSVLGTLDSGSSHMLRLSIMTFLTWADLNPKP